LFRQCAKCGKVGEKFINAPIPFRELPDDSIYGRKAHKSEGDARPQRRAEWLADFVLSRETELRRQIGVEIAEIHQSGYCSALEEGQICFMCELIEKLRGNK